MLLAASLLAAFGHNLVNLTEFYMVRPLLPPPVQMYHGRAPLLTLGPWAHYYGGYPIIEHLSSDSPWHGFTITVLTSGLLWLAAFFIKSSIKIRHQTVVEVLQAVIVENVLNTEFKATVLG